MRFTGGFGFVGALEAQVGSEDQLVEVMFTGLAARTVAGELQIVVHSCKFDMVVSVDMDVRSG